MAFKWQIENLAPIVNNMVMALPLLSAFLAESFFSYKVQKFSMLSSQSSFLLGLFK